MVMLAAISCQKDTGFSTAGKDLYIRIGQIDKDHVKTYSKVVKASVAD